MNIVKILVISIGMLFVFYRVGKLYSTLFNKENKISISNIVIGFILLLALFELFSLPFMIFNLNIKLLYYLSLTFVCCIIIASFLIRKNVNSNDNQEINLKWNTTIIILVTILLVIIIFQVFCSTYLFKENADDSFYISFATEKMNLGQMYEKEASTGLEYLNFSYTYMFSSWEVFGGFISRLCNINSPTFFHTVCPLVFIIVSYISYYILASNLFKSKKQIIIFLILLSIIFLFSGGASRFRGISLLAKIWHGKILLLSIIIPFILSKLIDYDKLAKTDITLLMASSIAAIGLNPISIYYVPIIYGCFMFYILIRKQFNIFLKLLITLIPNIIFLILYILLSFRGISEMTNVIESTVPLDFFSVYNFFMNDSMYIYLYLLSTVIIAILGDLKGKIFHIYIPLIAIIFLINPITGPLVAKYITHPDVYWRLYWLIPMEFGICYAITKLYEKLNTKIVKTVSLVFGIMMIIFFGKFVYSNENGFGEHENVEKIPQYIIAQTEHILNNSESKSIVMAPPVPLHSSTMRQLSSDIILFWSRDMYMLDNSLYNNNFDDVYKGENRLELYNIYYTGVPGYDVEHFNYLITLYNIDWVIINKDNNELIDYIENSLLNLDIEIDNYLLYTVTR